MNGRRAFALRDPRRNQPGRHGRRLPRGRRPARPGGRAEGPAGRARRTITTRRERLAPGSAGGLRARASHIAVIHDVGEATASAFIAMELIRGEKLSDTLLARTAAAPDARWTSPIEMAEGLARAHEQGRRPSRHQAGERDGHRGRSREDHRLRPRQAPRTRRATRPRPRPSTAPTRSRASILGTGRLHVAGAGARRARRSSHRRLLASA